MGAMIVSDRIAEPFMEDEAMFAHGFTFGGHPVAAAVAMANLDIFEREDLCGHVRAKEGAVPRDARGPARPADRRRRARRRLLPGDRAGQGQGDQGDASTTRSPSGLLRGFLSGELYRRGLICRADDRGDPVIQLSPPLIAGEEQFQEIEAVLRSVLSEAHDRMVRLRPLRARGADSMLTVQGLLDELGLSLAAGRESAEAPIRWVHISELLDPTPWMSGGELLLTTGMRLTDEDEQRAFVRRLVDHHVAGLGFGVGIEHETIPAAMVDEADRHGFAAVRGAVRDAVHRDHREGVRTAR